MLSPDHVTRWAMANGKGGSQKKTDAVSEELKRTAAEAAAQQEIQQAKDMAADAEIAERRNRLEKGGWVRRHNVERS